MPGAEVCLERNFKLPAETKRTQPRVASARENSPALSLYRSDKNELDRLRRVPPRGVLVGTLPVTLPCALLSLNGQEAYKSSAPPRGAHILGSFGTFQYDPRQKRGEAVRPDQPSVLFHPRQRPAMDRCDRCGEVIEASLASMVRALRYAVRF
jgi:hypothetical protein